MSEFIAPADFICDFEGFRAEVYATLYPEGGAHGRLHAEDVERSVGEIVREPEYADLTERDAATVQVAAIIHDVGYQERQPQWSGTQWEHPIGSVTRLLEMARAKGWLETKEQREWLHDVALLVLNHDNTNYIFPAKYVFEEAYLGGLLPSSEQMGSRLPACEVLDLPLEIKRDFDVFPGLAYNTGGHVRVRRLLRVLQEADSRHGNFRRTIDFTRGRGIPDAANVGGVPGLQFAWQGSGADNVTLAALRALLDANTEEGRRRAVKLYRETSVFVSELMQHAWGERDAAGFERPRLLAEETSNVAFLGLDELAIVGLPHTQEWLQLRLTEPFGTDGVEHFLLSHSGEKYGRVQSLLVETEKLSVDAARLRPAPWREWETVKQIDRVREWMVRYFAFDPLTQLTGGLTLWENFGGIWSWWYSGGYTVLSPVVEASTGTVLNGENWVELARHLDKPYVRVLAVN